MGGRDPGKLCYLDFARGGSGVRNPGKSCFLDFARGDWGVCNPSKLRFLDFARGSARWLTLAKALFYRLPGVEQGCATLANCVF